MKLDELLEINAYHAGRIADAIRGNCDKNIVASSLWEYGKAVDSSGIKYSGYLAKCIRDISRSLRSLSDRNERKQLQRIERAVNDMERKLTQLAYESEVK